MTASLRGGGLTTKQSANKIETMKKQPEKDELDIAIEKHNEQWEKMTREEREAYKEECKKYKNFFDKMQSSEGDHIIVVKNEEEE